MVWLAFLESSQFCSRSGLLSTLNLYGKDTSWKPPSTHNFRHVRACNENKGFDVAIPEPQSQRGVFVYDILLSVNTRCLDFWRAAIIDGPLAWLLFPTLLSDYVLTLC